jgi:hypothetical protein
VRRSVPVVACKGQKVRDVLDRHPKLVRVGPLDAMYAGARVWMLWGPSECSDSSGYLSVLSRIAEGGPRSRVGLKPRRDRLVWEFDPNLDPSMVAGDLDLDPTSVDQTMDRLVSLKLDQPIFVANLRGYVALGIDHGIGDAHAIIEIGAALSRAGAPLPAGFVPPIPVVNVTKPLATVARRILVGAPASVAADIGYEARMQRMRRRDLRAVKGMAESHERGLCGDTVPNYSTMFVKSERTFVGALRNFRDRYCSGTSTTALMFYRVRHELSRAGVSLTDTTGVLTDLRRYLPPGQSTLANMSPVVWMASPEGQALPEFAASFYRSVVSTYPATRAVVGAALWPLRSKSGGGAGDGHRGDGGRIEVVMSDVSRVPSLQKVRVRDQADPLGVVALPPAGRNYLNLAFIRSRGEIHLTATYYADVLPPETLRTALQRALTVEMLDADRA